MHRSSGQRHPLSLSSRERQLALAGERTAQACLRHRARALSGLFSRPAAATLQQAAEAALARCVDCRSAYLQHFERMLGGSAASLPLLRQMHDLIHDIDSFQQAGR